MYAPPRLPTNFTQADLVRYLQRLEQIITTLPNFVSNETVAGAATAWTLAQVPNPVDSLILVVASTGVTLIAGSGYTIANAAVTTAASYSAGDLRAWYSI